MGGGRGRGLWIRDTEGKGGASAATVEDLKARVWGFHGERFLCIQLRYYSSRSVEQGFEKRTSLDRSGNVVAEVSQNSYQV